MALFAHLKETETPVINILALENLCALRVTRFRRAGKYLLIYREPSIEVPSSHSAVLTASAIDSEKLLLKLTSTIFRVVLTSSKRGGTLAAGTRIYIALMSSRFGPTRTKSTRFPSRALTTNDRCRLRGLSALRMMSRAVRLTFLVGMAT